jgi:hypothetical protein
MSRESKTTAASGSYGVFRLTRHKPLLTLSRHILNRHGRVDSAVLMTVLIWFPNDLVYLPSNAVASAQMLLLCTAEMAETGCVPVASRVIHSPHINDDIQVLHRVQ